MTQPKKKLNGGEWALIIFGILVLLSCAGFGSTVTPKTPAKSTWCQTHAHDQWSGQMDPVIKRYLDECV